ncbi:hypothetical protein Hanom_Chr11g01036931 [Helianthus anomalus]
MMPKEIRIKHLKPTLIQTYYKRAKRLCEILCALPNFRFQTENFLTHYHRSEMYHRRHHHLRFL